MFDQLVKIEIHQAQLDASNKYPIEQISLFSLGFLIDSFLTNRLVFLKDVVNSLSATNPYYLKETILFASLISLLLPVAEKSSKLSTKFADWIYDKPIDKVFPPLLTKFLKGNANVQAPILHTHNDLFVKANRELTETFDQLAKKIDSQETANLILLGLSHVLSMLVRQVNFNSNTIYPLLALLQMTSIVFHLAPKIFYKDNHIQEELLLEKQLITLFHSFDISVPWKKYHSSNALSAYYLFNCSQNVICTINDESVEFEGKEITKALKDTFKFAAIDIKAKKIEMSHVLLITSKQEDVENKFKLINSVLQKLLIAYKNSKISCAHYKEILNDFDGATVKKPIVTIQNAQTIDIKIEIKFDYATLEFLKYVQTQLSENHSTQSGFKIAIKQQIIVISGYQDFSNDQIEKIKNNVKEYKKKQDELEKAKRATSSAPSSDSANQNNTNQTNNNNTESSNNQSWKKYFQEKFIRYAGGFLHFSTNVKNTEKPSANNNNPVIKWFKGAITTEQTEKVFTLRNFNNITYTQYVFYDAELLEKQFNKLNVPGSQKFKIAEAVKNLKMSEGWNELRQIVPKPIPGEHCFNGETSLVGFSHELKIQKGGGIDIRLYGYKVLDDSGKHEIFMLVYVGYSLHDDHKISFINAAPYNSNNSDEANTAQPSGSRKIIGMEI